jgi:hypothetical protein
MAAEIRMRNGNGRSGDVRRHLFERRSSGNTGTLQTMAFKSTVKHVLNLNDY